MAFINSTLLPTDTIVKLNGIENRILSRDSYTCGISAVGTISINDGVVQYLNLPSAETMFAAAVDYKHDFSAQAYGSHYEAILRRIFNLRKISARDKLGDAHHEMLGDVEIKVSLSTTGTFCVRQVRINRPIDYYLLCFVNTRFASPYFFAGFVPADEVKKMAVSQTHGCKGGTEGDDPMRSFDISMGSPELADLERYNLYV